LVICCLANGRAFLEGAPGGRVVAGQCAVLLLPSGTDLATRVPGDQQLAYFRLAVDPQSLAQDFGLAGGVEHLHQAVGGFRVFEFDAPMRRLQNDILALRLDRPGAVLRLEAASLQLLVAVLDRVLERPALPLPDDLLLRPREESRLHAARQLLGLRFDKPPTVAELARHVGTNPCKLNRGFKLLFGETVGECAMRLRMEQARRLLVDERLSVSEVSFKVGYQHHSSFTAAFSAHYGASPSAVAAAAHPKVH
jgi:AraC-like DNA-binding protein